MAKVTDRVKEVADDQAATEHHRQKLLTLASTQRHVVISYPFDMTDWELLDFLGYLTHEFRVQLPQYSATGLLLPRAVALNVIHD